jgi:hypothetical protein
MFRAMIRILFGFILACLAVGASTVAFVITPAEIFAASGDAQSERLSTFGLLTLLAATHSAIFAAPFALIAVVIGEWQSIRSPIYYIAAGILISLAGFAAQYASETGAAASIANAYAFKAYLTSGFVGGLIYWLFAGRSAGSDPEPENTSRRSRSESPVTFGQSVPRTGPQRTTTPKTMTPAAAATPPTPVIKPAAPKPA